MKEPRPRGRPRKILDEYSGFSLRMPAALHQELRHYAVYKRQPLNDVLVKLIADWWEAQPERETIRKLQPLPPFPKALRRT